MDKYLPVQKYHVP